MTTSPLDAPSYQLLFETSADALLLVSRDYSISAANQAVSEILGYGREEILAQAMPDLLARPSQWEHLCNQIENQQILRDHPLKCRTKAGRQMDSSLCHPSPRPRRRASRLPDRYPRHQHFGLPEHRAR